MLGIFFLLASTKESYAKRKKRWEQYFYQHFIDQENNQTTFSWWTRRVTSLRSKERKIPQKKPFFNFNINIISVACECPREAHDELKHYCQGSTFGVTSTTQRNHDWSTMPFCLNRFFAVARVSQFIKCFLGINNKFETFFALLEWVTLLQGSNLGVEGYFRPSSPWIKLLTPSILYHAI